MSRERTRRMKRLFLIGLLTYSSFAFAQMTDPNKAAARAFTEVGIDQKLNEQIPLGLKFRNEKGESVALGSYFHSKPVIIALVYYKCPMLCTQVLNGMVQSFRTLEFTAAKEFEVVTISIDPSETPDMAADKKDTYVAEYGRPGVENGWHFLVGDSANIKALANAVGFRYVYDVPTKQYAHASGIMIATPQGKLARYLYGIEYAAKDLTFSMMEAAQEKIGSPVDKLLLLCYHYDPRTGKYGVIISNILRGGGIVMIVLVGGYMYVNFRRDRKKALMLAKAQMN